jgi:DNA-binding transcriptional LysR family regulator
MELRHLCAIAEIARSGSVSAAASRLGYTQSAVSQQIKALEIELGVPLLTRYGGARPAQLTAAGSFVATHASAILKRKELIENEVRRLGAGRSAALRVGTLGSMAQHVLPQTLQLLGRTATPPKVQLVEKHGDAMLLAAIERGQLDVTFTHLPLPAGPFGWRHLLTVQQVLLVGCDQPVGRGDPAEALAEACRLPFIAFRNVRPPYDAIRHLGALGYTPQVVMHADDNRTLQNLVSVGLGVAVVPETAVDSADESIRIVRGISDLPPCPFGVAWHESARKPNEFIDCAVKAARAAAARLEANN